MAVITKAGISEYSDALLNRTQRALPMEAVAGISVSSVTSSSAIVSWNEPEKPTGPIAYYRVTYVYQDFTGELVEKTSTATTRRLKLDDLVSNVDYNVLVSICIEMPDHGEPLCGKNRGAGFFKTKPGGELFHEFFSAKTFSQKIGSVGFDAKVATPIRNLSR